MRKRKTIGLILSIIFCMALLMPTFLVRKKTDRLSPIALASVEDEFINDETIELIPTEATSSTIIGNAKWETNCSPFDVETKQRMKGNAITPNADDCGQIMFWQMSLENSFSPTKDDSICIWFYFIDVVSFKLSIQISNGGSDNLLWEFDSQNVLAMGTGWKLLSLNIKDFDEEKYLNKTYNSITIKYYSEANDMTEEEGYERYDVKTNDRLMIYHAFLSKNANKVQKSGILINLDKTFYKFSENFISSSSIYLGQNLKIISPNNIFEYLYVDKYDLTNYASSGKYYWIISVTNPEQIKTNVDFSDTIYFRLEGFYKITIQLYEKNTILNKLIMDVGINLYCEKYSPGSFLLGKNYSVTDENSVIISFKLNDLSLTADDFLISLSNNNAQISSYYIEDGVLYICVMGQSKGVSKLTISSNELTVNGVGKVDFSDEVVIDISSEKREVDLFMIILWTSFGAFCLGFVIYLLISLVKSRKNDVK